VLTPTLLPWLPGRSLSVKGIWIGLLLMAAILFGSIRYPDMLISSGSIAAWLCIALAVSSFISMNFTGSTTYTSLSGVLKEMRVALPIQIGLATLGLILWIAGLFL
jgi:acetyl-CoA decarbonylase/synthase complex subunit gamma